MKKNRTDIFIILGIFILYVFLHILIGRYYSEYPNGDYANHLIKTGLVLKALKSGNLTGILFSTGVYPPFCHNLAALCYKASGISLKSAALTNLPFVFLFILSVYLLGKNLGGRAAGITAAALGLTASGYLRINQIFLPDGHLVGAVAFSLFCLFRAGDFTDRNRALLFGLSLALGSLVKFSFFYFIIFPLAVIYLGVIFKSFSSTPARYGIITASLFLPLLIMKFFSNPAVNGWVLRYFFLFFSAFTVLIIIAGLLISKIKKDELMPFRNFLYAVLLFGWLAAPWYTGAAPYLDAKIYTQASDVYHYALFSRSWILQILENLNGIYLGAGLLIVISIIVSFFHPRKNEILLLAGGMFTGFILTSITAVAPDQRYILPLLPYAALLGGLIPSAFRAPLKNILYIFIIALAAIQLWTNIWRVTALTLPCPPPFIIERTSNPYPPDFDMTNISKKIFKDIKASLAIPPGNAKAAVIFLAPEFRMDLNSLSFYALKENFEIGIERCSPTDTVKIFSSHILILISGNDEAERRRISLWLKNLKIEDKPLARYVVNSRFLISVYKL